MTELTEKILSLDLRSASALQDAKAVSMEAKKSADMHAYQKMEEVQQRFKEKKESEAKVFLENFEEEKKSARDNLDQKMKNFDERIKIDVVVEDLISVVKERICP